MNHVLRVVFCCVVTSSTAYADFDEVTIRTKTDVSVTMVGDTPIVDVREPWFATIGDTTSTRITREDFYRLVDREDLARRSERRHTIGLVATAVGLGGLAFGAVMLARDTRDAYTTAGGITAVSGAVALGVGALFFRYADTVSEDEARYFADVHNATVRARRRMSLTAVPGGAGIAASGSF